MIRIRRPRLELLLAVATASLAILPALPRPVPRSLALALAPAATAATRDAVPAPPSWPLLGAGAAALVGAVALRRRVAAAA